jgi:hypothetical protein
VVSVFCEYVATAGIWGDNDSWHTGAWIIVS